MTPLDLTAATDATRRMSASMFVLGVVTDIAATGLADLGWSVRVARARARTAHVHATRPRTRPRRAGTCQIRRSSILGDLGRTGAV